MCMRVLIDNYDGLGPLDYTACVQFGKDAVIQRKLNATSSLRLILVLSIGLTAPGLNARLLVQTASGTFLFTGYVLESPVGIELGEATRGDVKALLVEAVSDEALLDRAVWTASTTILSGTAGQNWGVLGSLCSAQGLELNVASGLATSSRVALPGGGRWSTLASNLAGSTRSTYRALNSVIDVTPMGARIHNLAPYDLGVRLTPAPSKDLHWLASDVTVQGHDEPDAYVTELFASDGVTSIFRLSQLPFHPHAAQTTTIVDLFQGTSVNRALWAVVDASGHIAMTAGGLTCTGGSGRQNESFVSSVQEIEMGGNLLLEAQGVQLSIGSVGMLLGLYAGPTSGSGCFAGFSVTSTQGAISLTATVNGAASGSVFSTISGHLYTLRLRVYTPETERVRQSYTYPAAHNLVTIGGDVVPSNGWLELEVQDITNGTGSQATVLYSGFVPSVPPACSLGLLASGSLACSIKSVHCSQSAPVQVSVSGQGTTRQQLVLGTVAEGGACHLTSSGEIVFYPAAIPASSTLITVVYRSRRLAVARRMLPGQPGTVTSWAGSVVHPPAWSSIDCENAAKAILAFGISRDTALQGRYGSQQVLTGNDLWPGDALQLNSSSDVSKHQVTVRSATLELQNACNDIVRYQVEFANDFVESLNIQTSSRLAATSDLPQTATALDNAPASLTGLTTASITQTSVVFSTGLAAPVNGGFEVRRRDATFGPGIDSDLVLRTAAQTFSIPRISAVEQYFVRMYDGSSPPLYSAQSAAVFINIPM